MGQCFGIKNLRRCERQAGKKRFCQAHRRQPIYWIFVFIFTIVAGSASIYSALKSDEVVIDRIAELERQLQLGNILDEDAVYYNYLITQEKFEELVDLFGAAITNKTIEFSTAYSRRAEVYFHLRNFNKAVSDFQKAIKFDSSNAVLFNNLGVAFNGLGNGDSALAMYKKAINLDPNNDTFYRNAARRLFDASRFRESETYINKAFALDSDDIYNLNILAIIAQKLGDPDESEQKFDEALRLSPNNPITYFNIGGFFKERGDTSKSIKMYKISIEKDSTYLRPYIPLSNLLKTIGETDEAIKYYEKGTRIVPQQNSDLFFNYGTTLKSLNRHQEAIKQFKKATQIDSTDAGAFISWGATLRAMGNPQEATFKYEKAAEIDSTDAKIYYNWGNALKDLGRGEESTKMYRKFLKFSRGKYPERESRISSIVD